jgi:glycosyltransferase involved in cell wall biosynthesis
MAAILESDVAAQSEHLRSQPCEVSVVMPCLNEAETVQVCVRNALIGLSRIGVEGEVIVADNGSTDGSQQLAEDVGARVVHVDEKGYGAALLGGFRAARGRYVIMGDADNSYEFENIDAFVNRLRAGADLVIGNRFRGGIQPGAMPMLHYYLGNPVLSFLGRLFFGIKIGDFHCGLRGFSRDALLSLDLRLPGMEFASEMIVRASLAGLKLDEVPTILRPDGRSRRPHLRTWRDGWRHLRFLLLFSPKWLFAYPGFSLLGVGLFWFALLARGAVHIAPNVVLDIHTLVFACFSILIGVQLIVFGALARRFSIVRGILPPSEHFQKFFLGLTLEPLLGAALVILVTGVAGCAWAIFDWASSGFGPILYNGVMRVLVISLTMIAIGIQLAAAAFLASVFDLRPRA